MTLRTLLDKLKSIAIEKPELLDKEDGVMIDDGDQLLEIDEVQLEDHYPHNNPYITIGTIIE